MQKVDLMDKIHLTLYEYYTHLITYIKLLITPLIKNQRDHMQQQPRSKIIRTYFIQRKGRNENIQRSNK